MQQALSPDLDPDKSAFWKELGRVPRQFCEEFCDEENLTWRSLSVMSDIEFERLRGRWARFRTVPDFRRDDRLAISERIDCFAIFHNDGTSWRAPRQGLGGYFRTPDDPMPVASAESSDESIQIRSGNFIVNYFDQGDH